MKSEELKLAREITRRNFYVKKFFEEHGINVTLMGDFNAPLIVRDDNIVLSCYVHNFNLIFKDDTHNGKELFRVKLKFHPQKEIINLSRWLKDATHRKVYLFTAKGFYFAKYSKVMHLQVPLFTVDKSFAYYVFTRQKAIQVKETLKEVEPSIEIIY